MNLDDQTCYRALLARDARFDGIFFVGVTTTGVYCRPVCPARTPRSDRCRFFSNAAVAETSGFRPCLRCRPELAPGHAPVDAVGRTARLAAARIEAGDVNGDRGGIEALAEELGVSSRQLRRSIRQEFGVSPIELAQTKRLLLAKQLLTETRLPLIEICHASGFASVRRFNALFQSHYKMTPSALRKTSGNATTDDNLVLTLAYRPPYAWDAMLRFLITHAAGGVEAVEDGSYVRTIRIGSQAGWFRIAHGRGKHALSVEVAATLTTVLPQLLRKLRNQFDLDARPEMISDHLRLDPEMAASPYLSIGLRVPGCVDGFDLAVRAILGQRISVAAARTLAGRLAQAYGEPIETPFASLTRLSPTPNAIAALDVESLANLGITRTRAQTLIALAQAVLEARIDLDATSNPERTIESLKTLPGVGDWTAQYLAMRALQWPDAFPASDLALLKIMDTTSPRELTRLAEAWRPWRSYAAMILWTHYVTSPTTRFRSSSHE